MNKKPNPVKNFIKQHIFLSLGALFWILVLGSFGFSSIKSYLDIPRDLSPQFEYVGKRDFGCSIPICDASPYSNYYFATDLSAEELKDYFKGAKFIGSDDHHDDAEGKSTNLGFKLTSSGEYFGFDYFDSKDAVTANNRLNASSKKHIVMITSIYNNLSKLKLGI